MAALISAKVFTAYSPGFQKNYLRSWIDTKRLDGWYTFTKWKHLMDALDVCKPEDYIEFGCWLNCLQH